jgi:gliding motility-associated protein GldL
MRSIALFFETKRGKYIKNLIIGIGAAVVLIGALAKLEHWWWASYALIVGMCTEAFIFALLGLLPPHKDYYWERYYPDIDKNPHVEAYKKGTKFETPAFAGLGGASGSGSSATASLDKMLEDANINPANLNRLNDNFNKFSATVDQVKDISGVADATNEYSSKAREAASALTEMKDTFMGASNTLASFNNAANETAKFHDQVTVLTKNLGSLNQIYEVELQDANNHLKAMNKFYSNLVSASDAMQSSVDDANRAKEQMGVLAGNLNSLNQVYGNMLSAMQGRS